MTAAELDEQIQVQIDIAKMMPQRAILSIYAISIIWNQYLVENASELGIDQKSMS
jgi:hypothetical protein